MSARHRALALVLLGSLLATGCGPAEPAATSVPSTPTWVALGATNTPLPPTATLAPPTATHTPVPPTGTPSPTDTVLPPTETSRPTPTPRPPLTGSGGGVLAFVRTRESGWGIYVINADGSEQRRVLFHGQALAYPEWSPDGSQIVFHKHQSDEVVSINVMDADGSNERRLTHTETYDAAPVWSPDGLQIAFTRDEDIWIMNADGSDQRLLMDDPVAANGADWSPDGSQIVFESGRHGNTEIYVMDSDGRNLRRLTENDAEDWWPTWSPDGSSIAFMSTLDGDWEIYVIDADGGNLRQLTENSVDDRGPAWSPDGTRIAFVSNRDTGLPNDTEIYVMNADGSDQERITESSGFEWGVDWRPSDAPVAPIVAQLEGMPIDEFLQEAWRQLQLRDPDTLFANRFAAVYDVALGDQFTNLSAHYTRETQQLEREILDMLRTYNRGALSADQMISYDSLEWYLTTRVRGHAFTGYKILVNPVWGLQNWPIDLLMEHPLENRQDVENYVARLSSLDIWADQVIEGLEQNEQAGAVPPRYVLDDTIAQLDAILNLEGGTPRDADQIGLYTDFRVRVRQIVDLDQDEREALLDSALTEIEETLIPAYRALRGYLVHLTTIAVEDPNQWRLPGGKDYYAYLLAYYTGTNLSADEIHALGLAEVARLQGDIRNAAADLGYPADMSMAELNQRLNEESQIITGDALRQKYEEILAAADQAAEEYFDLRTSADVVIRVVQDGPPAYYALPEPLGDGPGEMPVNLDFSPLYVNYNEHVLVHHETIPGHHTQLALAQELDLPGYQRLYSANPYLQNYEFQAYTEGWAWYAEVLAWEMGLYEGDPLANLGRLRLHLLRAVRIVVDTGLHAKGWTLDEAAAYLEKVTGMPQSNAQLTRYLVNPGYPSGYTIGYLSILEMRQRAMDELGDQFDIKEFHNTVLGNGVLPICVLENVVDGWIAEKLKE